MSNGIERAQGGRVIPALRYRNGQAAIDWLCKAFSFEKKMVVPGESGRIAHAELVLENGMIMLGEWETDYRRFVRAPEPPERIKTQGIYVVVADVKAAGAEILLDLKTQIMAGATTQP
jgi:uncharacterized glyoxalase superfamily protein PhnB